MRAGTLRTLLRELRAGGVSEYSSTSPKGESISLKLGRLTPVEHSASAKEPSAQAAKEAAAESIAEQISARQAMLAELGVNETQLAEALRGLQ